MTRSLLEGFDIADRVPDGHVDLPRLVTGGLAAVFSPVYAPEAYSPARYEVKDTVRVVSLALDQINRNSDRIESALLNSCKRRRSLQSLLPSSYRSRQRWPVQIVIGMAAPHVGQDEGEIKLVRLFYVSEAAGVRDLVHDLIRFLFLGEIGRRPSRVDVRHGCSVGPSDTPDGKVPPEAGNPQQGEQCDSSLRPPDELGQLEPCDGAGPCHFSASEFGPA